MKRIALIGSLALLLSACSEGGMLNLKDIRTPQAKAVPGSEFVASSMQYKNSLTQNYKVQQATGSFNSKMSQTSTPRGYKIYYSVQGALISEDL